MTLPGLLLLCLTISTETFQTDVVAKLEVHHWPLAGSSGLKMKIKTQKDKNLKTLPTHAYEMK